MAYREEAVRQESGHLRGELSREQLSRPALTPVQRRRVCSAGPQLEPQSSSLCLGSAPGVGGQASTGVKEESLRETQRRKEIKYIEDGTPRLKFSFP